MIMGDSILVEAKSEGVYNGIERHEGDRFQVRWGCLASWMKQLEEEEEGTDDEG